MGGVGSHGKSGHPLQKELWMVANDWNVVGDFTLQRWIKNEHERWGFDSRINYQTDAKYRLHPSATGGRYLTAVIANSDYFELGAFVPLISATHGKFLMVIEKQHKQVWKWKTVKISRTFNFETLLDSPAVGKGVQVIGSRDSYVMIQVLRDSTTFEALLTKCGDSSYKVVKVVSFRCGHDRPCIMEATISPNYKMVLLRPSWGYLVKHKINDHSIENRMVVFNLETSKLVDGSFFCGKGTDIVPAFDPRYGCSRLAFGIRQATAETPTITLFDLGTRRRLAVTSSYPSKSSQNLNFSPDGRFLAALIGDAAATGNVVVEAVHVYDPETMTLLRILPCDSARRGFPLMPSSIFPLFSLDGRYLALQCSSRNRLFDHLLRVVTVPLDLSLKNLCRLVLRERLSEDSLIDLPLSNDLHDYLTFKHWMM